MPEGCPIHVVVERGKLATGTIAISAVRAKLHAQVELVDSFREHYRYMDMMQCDPVEADQDFDRITLRFADARAGDTLSEWGYPGVAITKHRRCPDAVWPRVVFAAGACDKPPWALTPPPLTPPPLTPPPLTPSPVAAIAQPVASIPDAPQTRVDWKLWLATAGLAAAALAGALVLRSKLRTQGR